MKERYLLELHNELKTYSIVDRDILLHYKKEIEKLENNGVFSYDELIANLGNPKDIATKEHTFRQEKQRLVKTYNIMNYYVFSPIIFISLLGLVILSILSTVASSKWIVSSLKAFSKAFDNLVPVRAYISLLMLLISILLLHLLYYMIKKYIIYIKRYRKTVKELKNE